MDLFESLKNKISGKNIKIVFPEGNDERIVKAAVRLANDGMIRPIILGAKKRSKIRIMDRLCRKASK